MGNHLLNVLDRRVRASGILLDGEKPVVDDVVVNTDKSVDGVVVDFALLAMLDGKLEQLDSLGVVSNACGEDDRLEPVKTLVLSGEPPQAREPAVAVNDEAVGEYHAGNPLIEQLDVVRRFLDGIFVALDDEAFDDFVVCLEFRLIGQASVMFGAILADPRGDAVVLMVVVQLVEPDAVHLMGAALPVDGELVRELCELNRAVGSNLCQEIHSCAFLL